MKKHLLFTGLAAILAVLLLCAGFGFYKDFFVENVHAILLTDGATGKTVEVTDPDSIQAITENVTENLRYKYRGKADSSGWCYSLQFLDEAGNQLENLSVLTSDGHLVAFGGREYQTANDSGINTSLLNDLLAA